MINGKTVLAIITARGGSKGLPRKNVLEAGGKPLIVWTILAAQQSQFIDRVILSSDDAEIIEISRQAGCEVPFVRPAELAQDDSPVQLAVTHALDNLDRDYDYVVMLPSTAPLRNGEDIDNCLRLCESVGAPAAVSVSPPAKSPFWMYKLDEGHHLKRLLPPSGPDYRRQILPEVFALNGAIYVVHQQWYRKTGTFVTEETVGFVMPPERSVDVDSWVDLVAVDALLNHTRTKSS